MWRSSVRERLLPPLILPHRRFLESGIWACLCSPGRSRTIPRAAVGAGAGMGGKRGRRELAGAQRGSAGGGLALQ